MQIIHDLDGISRVQFPGIRQMLAQRITQLKLREGEALTDVGAFFVVEIGDSLDCIAARTGCCIVSDPFGECQYGDYDFAPSFEWLEQHTPERCFEIAYMTTDDHFVAVFVPDEPGIDETLLAFCREYS